MMDEEAKKRQLLKNFLATWDKSGSQIEAAQQVFGDLKRFGQVIEGYSRRTRFLVGVLKNGQQAADKTYTVRSLQAAEVLALRADCAAHRNQLEQAQPLLEQAVQLEPNLAITHEAMGYYKYRKEDGSSADMEMKKAMELGSTSFVAPYYHGMLLLRGGLGSPEVMQEAIKSFAKATQINPQFAPAFMGLAQAYSVSPETQKQAVEAGIRAAKLEPTNRAYAVNLVHLLLNNNREADARLLAQRLLDKATSPQESQVARDLLERVKEHEQWTAQRKKQLDAAANSTRQTVVANAPTTTGAQATTTSSTTTPVDTSTLMAEVGLVLGIACLLKDATNHTPHAGEPALGFLIDGLVTGTLPALSQSSLRL